MKTSPRLGNTEQSFRDPSTAILSISGFNKPCANILSRFFHLAALTGIKLAGCYRTRTMSVQSFRESGGKFLIAQSLVFFFLHFKPMLLWHVHWRQKCLLGSFRVINVWWFIFLSWLLINLPLINHFVMVLNMSLCVGFFKHFLWDLALAFPCFHTSIHRKPHATVMTR